MHWYLPSHSIRTQLMPELTEEGEASRGVRKTENFGPRGTLVGAQDRGKENALFLKFRLGPVLWKKINS